MLKMNFNRKYNSGFSLIELMIVIAIIGILVAVALPQFAAMTEDAKKTKAKQDCDTIAQAIQKFNSLEGSTVEKLMDLKGKYLTNIDTLKDPWGNSYDMDPNKGIVFSKGPDSKSSYGIGKNGVEKDDKDNIIVSYIGALTLVDAKLEVNPEGGNPTDSADASRTYDRLHLYFNKAVTLRGKDMSGTTYKVDLSSSTTTVFGDVATTDKAISKPAKPTDPTTGATFRYFEANINNLVEAPVDLKNAANAITPIYGADSKEIILRYADGYTSNDPNKKLLIPGTHYINLTGAKNGKNPTFYEGDGVTGAEAAGTPVQIKNFD
ncbi:MAG: prepilin-type N-terminal cleavage/methylation domain-containing protein [Candidatus Wallbacteria bacterium]